MKLTSLRKLAPQKPQVNRPFIPPSESRNHNPTQVSKPVSESLPDYANLIKEKESKQRCQQLRYLIERQKQINATYPPLLDRILPIDGEEIKDDDIDNVDDLYDLIYLPKILWKINDRIICLRHPPFWKTLAEKL